MCKYKTVTQWRAMTEQSYYYTVHLLPNTFFCQQVYKFPRAQDNDRSFSALLAGERGCLSLEIHATVLKDEFIQYVQHICTYISMTI